MNDFRDQNVDTPVAVWPTDHCRTIFGTEKLTLQ